MAASGSSRQFAAKLGPGRVVLVVGESGAGKDAILSASRDRLAGDPAFVLPRRIVTRPSSAAEDHDSVSPAEFDALVGQDRLALHWGAHGLRYGIPIEIDDAVRAGRCAIFNASRAAVPAARARYANVSVAYVDVPAGIRAQRLANRGREAAGRISARLARASDFTPQHADLRIDNSGPLPGAVTAFLTWLRAGGPASDWV